MNRTEYSLRIQPVRQKGKTESKFVTSYSLPTLMAKMNKACKSRREMYLHILYTPRGSYTSKSMFFARVGNDRY